MTQRSLRSAFDALAALPSAALRGELDRRIRGRITLVLATLGPILAVLTGWALSGGQGGPVRQETLRGVFLADLVYIL